MSARPAGARPPTGGEARRPDLSIVVPTYNEEQRIATALAEIAAYGRSRGLRLEILVADDGSRDATLERAREAGPQDAELLLSSADRHRGKGSAVRRGMLAARGEVVVFVDADLSTPLSELDRLLPELRGGRPVVIGSRKLDPARIERRQPLVRQAMGRVFSWLARRLLHPQVADFTCGFKAFRHDIVRPLFEPLRIEGWAFDAEVLHVARRQGIPVLEIPVRWANRRETRVRLRRDVLRSAIDLWRIRRNGIAGLYDGGGQRR